MPHLKAVALARKTIYFSKLDTIHDIVIGLLINKVEFGLAFLTKKIFGCVPC